MRRPGLVGVAGLMVALGAGLATAHGLYEVALAARVPAALAWVYPIITDGLALVAYASTVRLTEGGRAYAWSVVVAAAGLSGLAQATYLAGGLGAAPAALRFGIGAWPAVAAAVVAHLLFLLHTPEPVIGPGGQQADAQAPPDPVALAAPGVHPPVVQQWAAVQAAAGRAASPARDRAAAAARRHAQHHGQLPSVSQLMGAAGVARGTAATALRALRAPETRPRST